MQIDTVIAALRGDHAPQRLAQQAMGRARDAWRGDPGAAALIADFESYGAGLPMADCPTLQRVFTAPGEAERLLRLLSQHYCSALAANPLGHPTFRHSFDGVISSLLLARAGRAQLLLQAREPGQTNPRSHIFADATMHDAFVAGSGTARLVRMLPDGARGPKFTSESLELAAGSRVAIDLSREALVIENVSRRLVMVRLVRQAECPAPGREYDIESGELIGQSAAEIATSRQEAILTLLGRMGRTEAAPEAARIALDRGDISLRWLALRECLALDSGEGFAALSRIARRRGDPLAANAGALRAQLLESYPQLAKVEEQPCPA